MRTLGLISCSALLAVLTSIGYGQDLPVMDGLTLWLDATDSATVFQDFFLEDLSEPDDFVGSWADKSGNEYHAFTADGAGDPIYQADAINGLPAVRFSGEFADGMVIDGLELQRPYTAFIANQYYGDIRGRTLQSQDINWLLGLWAGNFGHFAEGWVNSPQLGAEPNRPYVADAVGTETESLLVVNGVDWTVDSSPAGNPGSLAIAGAGSFPNEVSDADVSEIIIYDRVLSDDELTSVRTFLYDKYGTTPVEEIPPPPELIVREGTISQFMSAADLDFTGEFLYAVNAGGLGEDDFGDPLTIGDATFLDGTNAGQPDLDDIGLRINVANEAATWYQDPDYGDTIEDDNLEQIMRSIRWNVPPGLTIDLDVEAGESYKLQMLFAEEAWDRGFDIFMEDEEVVSDFIIHRAQDGMANRQVGVVYTREFVAGDDEWNIAFGGSVNVPDNNPLIQALTLESIEDLVLEPICNAATQGDVDGSGTVDFADFLVLSANFGEAIEGPGHESGDLDCSGAVDFADFLVMSSSFGQQVGAEAVPEPSSAALLLFAMIGAFHFRGTSRNSM